jgi:putative SOS response-associated peptidase YedK
VSECFRKTGKPPDKKRLILWPSPDAYAGLWDQWKNKEMGERINSCMMTISNPNDFVGEAHDRMPVLLLLPNQFDHWLSNNMNAEELDLWRTITCSDGQYRRESMAPKADNDNASLIKAV